jgi:hypothetical protein
MGCRYDIRVRLDSDGVVAAFAEEIERRLGFRPGDPAADTAAMWAWVAATPGFWEGLDLLPGAMELWEFVRPYAPSFLTGVGSDPAACRAGKKAFFLERFRCRAAVVVESSRKAEFCRPGDILVDDSRKNVDAWEAAGGIGVLHADAASTVAALRALGLDGAGGFSEALLGRVAALRADPAFARPGYSGYVLSRGSQALLVERFGVPEGPSGRPWRLVCQHVTRQFPAGMDTVDDAHPTIEVVGAHIDDGMGVCALAVEVDGGGTRPDGGHYHVTYALDDGEESAAERESAGGRRPAAADSNALLGAVAAGGGPAALANLGGERIRIEGEYAILDRDKMARLRRARRPAAEEVREEAMVHPSGLPGRRVVRSRGGTEVVVTECSDDGVAWRKHCEDGPAILRLDTATGEVLYAAWYLDGEQVDPQAPPAASMST